MSMKRRNSFFRSLKNVEPELDDCIMDKGATAASQNLWAFEIAWEVANKVGGIYQVIKSKAPITVEELGEQYCLLGPYNESCVRTEVDILEPHHYVFQETIQQMRDAGIKVVFGRWLIEGYPKVILFDISSAAWKLDEFKHELWEASNIGIPWHDRESNDAVIFGALVAWFLGEEILAEEPGDSEADLWDRLGRSMPVEESDVVHIRSHTRSEPAPSATDSRKIMLPVKKTRSKVMNLEHEEAIIVRHVQSKETISVIRKSALQKLSDSLTQRYAEFEKSSHVLSKIAFIDTNTWPNDLKELAKFGVEDVKALYQHFLVPLQNAGIDTEIKVLREFRDIKMYYGPRLADIKREPRQFWPWVFSIDEAKFHNFFLLVEIVLCIPFSTAVVERGFSSVRRILTDWRASLSPKLVADCLHFSTRRANLSNKAYRTKLIDTACDTFLAGAERDKCEFGYVTKRRVNKILNGLQEPVSPSVSASSQTVDSESAQESDNEESDNEESEYDSDVYDIINED